MAALLSAIIHIITEVGVLCEETIRTARVGAVQCSCWAGGGSGLIYKCLDDKEVPPCRSQSRFGLPYNVYDKRVSQTSECHKPLFSLKGVF
ncbi:Uncharacterized protein HZ326_24399 [Fusarium oxysporum f. sp. albedinis]|nr:Uncharacterized protein HZ326_24399 [Fusarium oxysporum f. sp. albedinis]